MALDELRQNVIDELVDILPVSQSGQGNIQTSIEQIATPLSAIGLVSLVALLWGASGMMASIRLGLETAMTIDAARAGIAVREVELDLEHRATGRDLAGFLHRARQLLSFVRVYVSRRFRLGSRA